MKHIDFDFNGRTYAFSFTAEALFQVYDRFGACDDILEATHCLEPTAEGWRNCCWLAALMAAQGELQRRAQGYDKQPMLTAEELRCGVMAADNARLRMAVRRALEQGFHREIPDPDTEREVNLVLKEREEAQKKTELLTSVLDTWQRALGSLTSAPSTPSSSVPEPPST
jgi:hypothetical protein